MADVPRHVLISANPRAGYQSRQSIIEETVRQLAANGFTTHILDSVDALADQSRQWLAAGALRAVIAAGGDGTVRLVAEKTPPGTPLLVLPLGTENLLARYLEIPPDPAHIARLIVAGQTVQLDAGSANGHLFALMAGCGFDAEVVRRLHASRRGHIHRLSYAKPMLEAVRTYTYPELRVTYAPARARATTPDEAHLTEQIIARWVFVANLPRYACGLSFAPQASGQDGLLDLCTFRSGTLWNGLWYLGGVVLGRHQNMRDFTHVQTSRLRIEAAAGTPYQLDGDPGGELPVEISVLPRRLTLLVSRNWAERNGLRNSHKTKAGDA